MAEKKHIPTDAGLRQSIRDDEAALLRLDMRKATDKNTYRVIEERMRENRRLLVRRSKPPKVKTPRKPKIQTKRAGSMGCPGAGIKSTGPEH